MLKIRRRGDEDEPIEEQATEWGVRWGDGFVVICADEVDARATRQMTGGEIVSREVYMTAWEVEE